MNRDLVLRTALTLGIGAAGAALAYALHMPAPFLTGPSILVTLACLAGLKLGIPPLVRDTAFIFIGINIGSGVTPAVADVITKWPVGIVAMALMLAIIILSGSRLLQKLFGYERRSAVLAAAPGHLSFVLSMGASIGADVRVISIVQSIRVLALTLIVPFTAMLAGIRMDAGFLFDHANIDPLQLGGLFLASIVLGFVFRRISVPAPFLMAGMLLSAITHVSETTPGVLPAWMSIASFSVLGTLIGTRFSGVTLAMLRSALAAGILLTLLAVACATLTAWPVWELLDMPPTQVLIAFAPGGLETMITMGVFLGAEPNFVAAHHVARLFILAFMIPAFVGRSSRKA